MQGLYSTRPILFADLRSEFRLICNFVGFIKIGRVDEVLQLLVSGRATHSKNDLGLVSHPITAQF